MLENPSLNNIIFFNAVSPKIKGLNWTTSLIAPGSVSIGKIVFEKNNNNAPTEIAPIFAVSPDLNIYPIIIPSKTNTLPVKNEVNNNVNNITGLTTALDIINITVNIINNCIKIIMTFEIYWPRTNKISFVGVIKLRK